MRKIFSLVIGACFLINNVSFALCPPLISGNLAEDNHEYKFYVMAEMGLQDYLQSVNTFTDIANLRDEKSVKKAFKKHDRFSENETFYTETTVFNPAVIAIGSREVSQVGENSPIFMVPVFVEKNGQRENYRLLFSTIKDPHNGYPTALCTLKEFNKIENAVKTQRVLPQRDAQSAAKLAEIRYTYSIQNERIIDPFLEKLIKKKGFTEFEDRAEKVLEWNEDTFPGRRTPERYLAKNHSDYIKTELNKFLKIVDTDFDETFKNKNIVFIRVPDGVSFPKIRQEPGGVDLEVRSHTSEHAVYTLIEEEDYDRLITETNVTDNVKNILKEIVADMAHEAGVIYRLPWILAQTGHDNSWRYSNGLDALYASQKILSDGKTNEMANFIKNKLLDFVKPLVRKGSENLDHLLARGINREYAAAKTDKKIAEQIEDLIIDSSEICKITDEFIKRKRWEPILGATTYELLAASKAALPHKFNYSSIHVKTFAVIIRQLAQKAKIKRSIFTTETIDLDYIQNFFETLFKECACKLTSAQYFDSSLPNNWEKWFSDPPKYVDELLQITVKSTNEKKNGSPKKFIINVAAGGNTKSDNKKIYIEANSNEHLDLPPQTLSIDIDALDIEKDIGKLENMIDSVLNASAPGWVEDAIAHNLNSLGKLPLQENHALLFSEKVTFNSGVGRLLTKLAKAGIKIAVVAKTEKQRNIIDYLNAIELENFDNKIFYGEDVATAARIEGVRVFDYFRIEDDGDEFIPDNVHIVKDLTVLEIIESLGKACCFADSEITQTYTATEIFGKAA